MTGREIEVRPFGWEPSPRLAELAARSNPDEDLSEEAARLVFMGMSRNTVMTYAFQWRKFVNWCGSTGRAHEPGMVTIQTVIEWMNELWRRCGRYGRPTAPETVALSLKVIAAVHRRARRVGEVGPNGQALYGYVSPTRHPDVHAALRGYRKQWAKAGHRPDDAYPLTPDELAKMIGTLDLRTPMGVFDTALLAIGYDLGGRRVELSELNMDDVEPHVADPGRICGDDYVLITIAMSKTDQDGRGAEIPLYAHPAADAATCPVRAALRVFDLLAEHGFTSGPFFRRVNTGGKPRLDGGPKTGRVTSERMYPRHVEWVVAHASAVLTRGKPGKRMHIVPHSLRGGSATSAAEGGADTAALNDHFRWSHRGTTANRYVRAGRRRTMNPVRGMYADRDRKRREQEQRDTGGGA